MSFQDDVLRHIVNLEDGVNDLLSEIDAVKNITPERKAELIDMANGVVLSALGDAKQSITTDANSSYFLMPLIVSCITYGQIFGEIASKKEMSLLMSYCGSMRLINSPIKSAQNNIEEEFKASKYPFDVRGYRAKFCKEMWNKYPIITSLSTIETLFDSLNKLRKYPVNVNQSDEPF